MQDENPMITELIKNSCEQSLTEEKEEAVFQKLLLRFPGDLDIIERVFRIGYFKGWTHGVSEATFAVERNKLLRNKV